MDRLPPELLDSILSLVPPAQLQHTTLALLLALPRSPISLALLWRHLRLTREGQSWAAALSLHSTSSTLRNAVQTADVEAWRCVSLWFGDRSRADDRELAETIRSC